MVDLIATCPSGSLRIEAALRFIKFYLGSIPLSGFTNPRYRLLSPKPLGQNLSDWYISIKLGHTMSRFASTDDPPLLWWSDSSETSIACSLTSIDSTGIIPLSARGNYVTGEGVDDQDACPFTSSASSNSFTTSTWPVSAAAMSLRLSSA